MLTTLTLITCIGAATVGGVFFAFSTFVLKSLAQLPAAQGIAAMQRINVVVLNPMFMGAFFGTGVLAAACAMAALGAWGQGGTALLLLAGVVYILGSVGVTIAFNVPRNERLARLEASSQAALAYWPVYVREWLLWNHVRTVACVLSAAFSGSTLTL